MDVDFGQIAGKLCIPVEQVTSVVERLDRGESVFYLARFGHTVGVNLDESQLRSVHAELIQQRQLAERKESILLTLANRERLTADLEKNIRNARTLRAAEDWYVPAKSKKRNAATVAIGRGLQPLADEILSAGLSPVDLSERAEAFVNPDKDVASAADAIKGASDILAQRMSERVDLKETLRRQIREQGHLTVRQHVNQLEEDEIFSADPPTPDSTGITADPQPLAGDDDPENATDQGVAPKPDAVCDVTSDQTLVDGPAADKVSGPAPAETTNHDTTPNTPVTVQQLAGHETDVERRRRRRDLRRRRRLKLEASFKDCYDFSAGLKKVRSHQWLKIDRGERVLALDAEVRIDQDKVNNKCLALLFDEDHPHADSLRACAERAVWDLAFPVVSREVKQDYVQSATESRIRRLANRWRQTLLQTPISQAVLAVHPTPAGIYAVVALDSHGEVLDKDRLKVSGHGDEPSAARSRMVELIKQHHLTLITIGGREAEHFIAPWLEEEFPDEQIAYSVISPAGTDVYARSPLADEELSGHDRDTRRAIALGRRLIDPLGEYAKIDPLDMDIDSEQAGNKNGDFSDRFADETRWCLHRDGIDVNRAGPALLRFVSGLDEISARSLVQWRTEHGDFQSREQLIREGGLSESAVDQCVGFLRIDRGTNPLDARLIHPRDYESAQKLMALVGADIDQLRDPTPAADHKPSEVDSNRVAGNEVAPNEVASEERKAAMDGSASDSVIADSTGDWREKLATLDHAAAATELGIDQSHLERLVTQLLRQGPLMAGLAPSPPQRRRLPRIEDLTPGTMLSGRVVNIVDFGVFVDIGLVENGLIHISRLANQYVGDPRDIVDVGESLTLWVVDADQSKGRVALTAIEPGTGGKPTGRPQGKPRRSASPSRNKRESFSKSRGKRSDQGRQRDSGHQRSRTVRVKKPKKPLIPITDEMKSGAEPMRTFGDLKQFFDTSETNDGAPPDVPGEDQSNQ